MGDASQVISSFPLPPAHYYKFYSNDNVAKNIAPKPPNAALIESYSMFGNNFSNDDIIIRPLESQQIRRLYPQHFDRKKELKKMNHSLLVNFLDLVDILINAPESTKRTEKIDDMTLLFLHIHHLLNEYRPHQARETLRVMLELQKRQRIETARRFNYHLEKVRGIVNNAFANLMPIDEPNLGQSMDIDEFSDNKESSIMDIVEREDRLMCEIVDEEISY